MGTVVLYVGTEQGVVAAHSEDGVKWEMKSHDLQDWEVSKLGFHPDQPNRVFAGTRGDGVWASEDFGQSWGKPSYGRPGPGKVRSMAVHPQDPDTVYAGGEPIEIFVSHDAGQNWDRLESLRQVPSIESVRYPRPTVEPHVRDIAVDPKTPTTMYAALQVGYLVKSTDGGESWVLMDKGIDPDVHSIAIDPVETNRVYAATGGGGSRSRAIEGGALYMSSDSGQSWSPTAMEFIQQYSVPMVINPGDPKTIYSALANGATPSWRNRPTGAESIMIRTRDGGKSWEQLEKGLEEISKSFAEAIVVDPENPDHLYAGLRSGDLYASRDGGDSWAKLNLKVPSVTDMYCAHI